MHAFTFSVYINNSLLSVCLDGYIKGTNRVTVQRTDIPTAGASATRSAFREFEDDFPSALLVMQTVMLHWQRLAVRNADSQEFQINLALL
jgi:hypothetical protein